MGRLISKLIKPSDEHDLYLYPRSVKQAERDPGVLARPNITCGAGHLDAVDDLDRWLLAAELRAPE